MKELLQDNSRPKHREGKEVLDEVKKNEFVVNFFKEQTCLYIPRKMIKALGKGFEDIGRKRIFQLAIKIYTEKVLEDFPWIKIGYENSLMLELPSGQNNQVEELKRKIKENYDATIEEEKKKKL